MDEDPAYEEDLLLGAIAGVVDEKCDESAVAILSDSLLKKECAGVGPSWHFGETKQRRITLYVPRHSRPQFN